MTLALFKDNFFLFFEQAFVADKICTSVDLETVVRFLFFLAMFTCLPWDRTAFSLVGFVLMVPLWSASFTFVSCAGWTYTSACKMESSLPLCSDSRHVSFLTPSSFWSHGIYFAELFWHCLGVMCFWYEEGEHSVNVNFCCSYCLLGFIWNGKKKKTYLSICPMVKDKIWKQTFKDQILHLA